MRIILSASVLMLLTASVFAADAVPDGEWAVEIKPNATNKLKGTTQQYDDVITIKGGRMTTKVSTQYGFPDGPCTLKTEGGAKLIVCELKDDKHGSNLFTLQVKGKAVAGTLKWSKIGEDGKPKQADYAVTGAAK